VEGRLIEPGGRAKLPIALIGLDKLSVAEELNVVWMQSTRKFI
jgi:hypothetical protein